jgi:hypothetical protein
MLFFLPSDNFEISFIAFAETDSFRFRRYPEQQRQNSIATSTYKHKRYEFSFGFFWNFGSEIW